MEGSSKTEEQERECPMSNKELPVSKEDRSLFFARLPSSGT